MGVITIITDHGLRDYTVSAIKGSIIKQLPNCQIVDISHEIPKFSILQAAFVLRNAFPHFPDGTVHIIGVMPKYSVETPHLAIQYNKQFFVGADNGIFDLLFEKKADQIVELNIGADNIDFHRPTQDIFVKAACHIARGGTLEVIGKAIPKFSERLMFRAVVQGNIIRGSVIYIDHFGNVITNISKTLFQEIGKGKPFNISFRSPGYDINEISKTYADVPQSEKLAIFGPTGFLEIAINVGNASELLGLEISDLVCIEFND